MKPDHLWAGFYGLLMGAGIIAAFLISLPQSGLQHISLQMEILWLSLPEAIIGTVCGIIMYDLVWQPAESRQMSID